MSEKNSYEISVFRIILSFFLSLFAFYIVLVFGYMIIEFMISFILDLSIFQFISRSRIGSTLVSYFFLILPLYWLCVVDYKLISFIVHFVNKDRTIQIFKSYLGLSIAVGIICCIQFICMILYGANFRLCILTLISSIYFFHQFSLLKE